MPQATRELRERWDIADGPVIAYLAAKGFKYTQKWEWLKPTKNHQCTQAEISAILFLIQEWDWGGLVPDSEWDEWTVPGMKQ